jgi:Holliday junction resolvasome RuvABC endonuclease subunit
MLELDGDPSPDAADALATALCHANQRRLSAALRGNKVMAGGKQ